MAVTNVVLKTVKAGINAMIFVDPTETEPEAVVVLLQKSPAVQIHPLG